jgi:hypothetical protein
MQRIGARQARGAVTPVAAIAGAIPEQRTAA